MTKTKDESIFIDFIYEEGNIPDGYTAYYTISLNNFTKKQGDLILDNNTFKLRIKKGELKSLLSNRYKLNVIIVNDGLGYADCIYTDTLIIE